MTVNRRELLKAAAATALGTCLNGAGLSADTRFNAGTRSKPNVVICTCDQLRSFEVGCYGNPVIRTPHMDNLAANGCRFDIAVASNPLCVPSRSTLLSGQYSRTCAGALFNDQFDSFSTVRDRFPQSTLAELFQKAGYRTAAMGKWHLALDPFLLGFEEVLYPVYVECERNYGELYLENTRQTATFACENAREILPDQFDPAFTATRVRDYIRRNKSGPFLLWYNILQPHMAIGPGNMPDKYVKMYDRNLVPLRKNVYGDKGMAYDEYWFKIYTICDYSCRQHGYLKNPFVKDRKKDKLPPDFDLRDLTAYYYGATTCADDQLGGLIQTLEENGITDNTIIVLCADHGDMLGSHQRFNKGDLFEESIRVPIIFSYPGQIKPSVNREQVAAIVDILPTLLDLCGISAPNGIQGQSLAPILKQERRTLDRDFQFIETFNYHAGIRTPTHMYGIELNPDNSQIIANERLFFFDLREDPYQLDNLATTERQAQLADELRHKLSVWNQSTPWLEL